MFSVIELLVYGAMCGVVAVLVARCTRKRWFGALVVLSAVAVVCVAVVVVRDIEGRARQRDEDVYDAIDLMRDEVNQRLQRLGAILGEFRPGLVVNQERNRDILELLKPFRFEGTEEFVLLYAAARHGVRLTGPR